MFNEAELTQYFDFAIKFKKIELPYPVPVPDNVKTANDGFDKYAYRVHQLGLTVNPW